MSLEESQDSSLFPNKSVDPDGTVGKVAASAHDTVDRAAQGAQDIFDQFQSCADKAVEKPRTVIRENPVAAVVLALSVGFLWGRLGGSRG